MRWMFLFLVFFYSSLNSSVAQPPSQLKNYFRNPMGIPMDLSANFGELRPNHWHMGLDIRTAQKENQPVYAAAGGYIAHIGIRPQSFGRFVIINHPNGLSTLYAHLNDFFPELEQFVTEKQYAGENWALELDPDKKLFPVTKGQFIAYSGNTGGSQGPHLHFEIFDTETGKRLNPLLFDFGIADNVPPTLVRLAVYDRSKSVYDQSPKLIPLKNTDSGYIIPKLPVFLTGLNRLSFAIQAYDRLSGSNNPNGIYAASLYVDESERISFVLDSVDYDETAYMNAHIDYKYDYNGGAYLQHLSRMPGDRNSIYKPATESGVIELNDTSLHMIRINVMDPYGNTSILTFNLQLSDSLSMAMVPKTAKQQFIPLTESKLERPGFRIRVSDRSIYDTVPVTYITGRPSSGYAYSTTHQVNDPSIPVHNDLEIWIKPDRPVPPGLEEKLLIQRTQKGSTIRRAQPDGEGYRASFGDFGVFQLVVDNVPPSINELGKGDTINLSAATRILFTPTDNFGIVKIFRAELNGSWLRFTNDKSRNWIYVFDERCPYGVHELKVVVEDHVGNVTTRTWWFKRYPYTPPVKKAVKKAKGKKNKGKKR